jgi:hypothetical protein
MHVQVTGEIDITPVLDSEVVTQELQRNNVEKALKRINCLGHADGSSIGRNAIIALVTEDDGTSFASGDLCKG